MGKRNKEPKEDLGYVGSKDPKVAYSGWQQYFFAALGVLVIDLICSVVRSGDSVTRYSCAELGDSVSSDPLNINTASRRSHQRLHGTFVHLQLLPHTTAQAALPAVFPKRYLSAHFLICSMLHHQFGAHTPWLSPPCQTHTSLTAMNHSATSQEGRGAPPSHPLPPPPLPGPVRGRALGTGVRPTVVLGDGLVLPIPVPH